jgi:hypothetical protein
MDDFAVEKTKTAFLLKIGERWVGSAMGSLFFFLDKVIFWLPWDGENRNSN